MGPLENNLQKLGLKEERLWSRLKCNYVTECSDVNGNRGHAK